MVVKDTHIKFLLDGKNYHNNYLSLINNAKKTIILHTYIFELDDFGERVYESLKKASQRGIVVSIVVDGFGTKSFRKDQVLEMKSLGIKFNIFNRLRWTSIHRWGRRLHHKILVADGEEAIIGGINIVTPFDEKYEWPRLDFAFYLKGKISTEIEDYCLQIFSPGEKKKFNPIQYNHNDPDFVRFSVNDWVYGRKCIAKNYVEILKKAKSEVIIINSYFFPRKKYLNMLVAASRRGVLVKLILPKISDWQSHVLASEYLYSYLLKNKIQVYQWNKSVLHGKMAVIDRKITMLGSFNLHYTSFQGNLEMNIEVSSESLSKNIGDEIDSLVIENCKKVEDISFEQNGHYIRKIKRFFYYSLISFISNFLLGFIYQEEIDKQERVSRTFAIVSILLSFFVFLIGILGLVLPVIPGLIFIVLSLVIIYPIIIKNYKNL